MQYIMDGDIEMSLTKGNKSIIKCNNTTFI